MSVSVESRRCGDVDAEITGITAIDAAIDRLADTVSGDLDAAACEQVVRATERQSRRLAAIRLRTLATARRTQVAQDAGFPDTGAWAAERTTTSRAAAARQVALATELDEGYDATARALDEGLVSSGHAAVIVGATGQLPAGVTAQQKEAVEQRLIADARRLDPDQLRRRARRVLETVEPDEAVVDAHENIHDHHYRHTYLPDGTIRFRRRP